MQKEQLFLKLLRVSDLAKPKRIKKKDEEARLTGNPNIGLAEKVILRILLDEKKINQRTIAKKMKISAQGVSENIKKLIEMEYVYKEQGVSYNENFILLTEKGEKRAQSLHHEFSKDADIFFSGVNLTQEELLILDILLSKMFESFRVGDSQ